MNKGKLIFVSGLSGAEKTTLIDEALKAVDNLKALLTYTTRPMRQGEGNSTNYIFVNDDEYDSIKKLSRNWDETVYDKYKYGSDAYKINNDLSNGINVIVSVTPNMDDIRSMEQFYEVKPTTIWINTDSSIALNRISDDQERSKRVEDDSIKLQFDIIFEPTGILNEDIKLFTSLVNTVVAN